MVKTSTSFALAALVGYAAAECPNACSGHGTCGAKDSCACYQNYQGNDCSERTCYFGLAHVDSPKGDLNADGLVSGPLTTVITGSEVYPWGTTEQFPNANANEGHFYMECSNKGICDRKTGTCDCFDGYTGTACARAACPNDCSGHGTCESIKELAEMRSFDTNAHDAATTRVAGGATGGHDYSSAIEESYSYDLWDSDKTMGCKCDPVYYGADCSLKKCKYGVDPLFYDNTDGAIHQTTVVHLGSASGGTAATVSTALAGTFKLVFYDVFGEKYVTSDLTAAPALTAATVQRALEALPNGVISNKNTDVTGTPPAAVDVAMAGGHSSATGVSSAALVALNAGVNAGANDISTTGGVGAGCAAATCTTGTAAVTGAGFGTQSISGGLAAGAVAGAETGNEFTITFKTNPGILKALEVDTRGITNGGNPDYWVANMRQGQFKSRYTTNLGRVQALAYGSTKVFTNTDLTASVVATSSLVKVGGQEFLVAAEGAYFLTLSEPYLGAAISPTLTNTGVTSSAYTAATGTEYDRLTVAGVDTAEKVSRLSENSPLWANGCAFQAALGIGTNAGATPPENTPIASGDTKLAFLPANADCLAHDAFGAAGDIIYRRSDDPNNQNMYKAPLDTGAAMTKDLMLTRGSSSAYIVEPAAVPGYSPVKAYVGSTRTFTGDAAPTTDITAGEIIFVNGVGPLQVVVGNAAGVTAAAAVTTEGTKASHLFPIDALGTTAALLLPAKQGVATALDAAVATGSVVLLHGRRYRVKTRGTGAGSVGHSYVQLAENYPGGGIRKFCSACVDTYAEATGVVTFLTKKLLTTGDRVAVSGRVHESFFSTVIADYAGGSAPVAEATHGKITTEVSSGGFNGVSVGMAGPDATLATGSPLDLFVAVDSAAGVKAIVVTESAVTKTTAYQYVAQCSNRGSCDASTGLCKCFKGYSSDNCSEQNMLAQ